MKHFSEEEDILFLQELRAALPFDAEHGQLKITWEKITERVAKVIKRSLTSRSLQDRWNVLVKKFKKDEAVSLAASGISDEISQKDVLIRECFELMEAPKPAKAKSTPDAPSVKHLALARLKDKQESNEHTESDSSVTELKPLASKRSKDAVFMDLISEQVVTSRIAYEEKAAVKKAKIMQEEAKLELDRAKLEHEKAKMEFEIKKYNDELDLRKQQQKTQQQKDESMISLFTSMAPLIAKLTDSKKSQPKKKR